MELRKVVIVAAVLIVTNHHAATSICDHGSCEASCCAINYLIFYREHVRALNKARCWRILVLFDLFIDVKAQVFSLAEQVALAVKNKSA